jgi:hypothetical protein
MDTPPTRFHVNSRVKLRDGVDPSFYGGFSRTGNEGWVRKIQIDKLGYPHILVEWDKNHWSYNGAPDTWTWQDHFDEVEEIMDNKKQEEIDVLKNDFETKIAEIIGGIEGINGDVQKAVAVDLEEGWNERLREVHQVLKNTRAYIVVAIDERENDISFISPCVFYDAQDEALGLICQAQLSQVNQEFHGEAVAKRLAELNVYNEDDQ